MYKPGATSQTIQYLFIPNASGGVSLFFILHVSVGHDSAVLELENKGISLAHDSSLGELLYLTVRLLRGTGLTPSRVGTFQGIFPWLITLCQPVLRQHGRKLPTLPSTASHNLLKLRRTVKVQPWTDNRCISLLEIFATEMHFGREIC